MKLIALSFLLLLNTTQANEAPAEVKLQSPEIYIDGQMKDKAEVVQESVPVEDDELKFFKNELENVKNLNKSFKQKSKTP